MNLVVDGSLRSPLCFLMTWLLHNYRKDNEINTSSSKSEMNYFLITVLQYHKPSSCTRPETRDRYDSKGKLTMRFFFENRRFLALN